MWPQIQSFSFHPFCCYTKIEGTSYSHPGWLAMEKVMVANGLILYI